MFYLCVYEIASPYRVVLLDESEVFPVLPDYWPWYDETLHNYRVGMDENAILDSCWDADTKLTDAAVALYGVAESERLKYKRGIVIKADEAYPRTHYVIDPATLALTYSPPALSAQQARLELAFISGDPDIDADGGPDGEPSTAAEPSVTVRCRKLYADGTLFATATDSVTLIPSRGRSGRQTQSLAAGTKDFTFMLPAESGPVTLEVRSATANTSAGRLVFYRDAPIT